MLRRRSVSESRRPRTATRHGDKSHRLGLRVYGDVHVCTHSTLDTIVEASGINRVWRSSRCVTTGLI